jgi:hypothetical protein
MLTRANFVFRYDASSRNVFRYPDLKEDIEIRKVRDHYIFTVESVGAVPPEELVKMLSVFEFLDIRRLHDQNVIIRRVILSSKHFYRKAM